MGYGSIVSIFDRLSVKTVLTNHTGSYIGFLATIAFIIVCLVVLIPSVNQYFKGAYFESEFVSAQFPKNIYNTGSDLIVALSFRNKKTNEFANHSQIIDMINSNAYYVGYEDVFKTEMVPCKPQVFLDAINPIQVPDCIMLPSNLKYDITPVQAYVPYIELFLSMKCDDVFRCNQNNPYYAEMSKYIISLAQNYYFQFIFNSKVIDEKGLQTNQFHKVYSTEFQSEDSLSSWLQVSMSQKKYFVDDSILPWWNNRTYENLFWQGNSGGMDVPKGAVIMYGYIVDIFTFTDYHYSYRYYKKLDFLLGMIGGAVFLIFLFFWVPCSYVNRTLQKMKNAEELFLTKDQFITTEQNLHKVKIPIWHILTRWLPGNSDNKIIEEAQKQIDIVKFIKKMKVTHRNLRTRGLDLTFKTRDVDLLCNEPQQFLPDRPVLQTYEITYDAYQALGKAQNTHKVYQNNAAALALTQNSSHRIDGVIGDEVYEKNKSPDLLTCGQKIVYGIKEFFRFFDVFGAKPMLNAQPETSSCWGFLLTLIIIALSVLTFCLTIKNMNSIKIITSHKYEKPIDHNYEMITGQDCRIAFCTSTQAMKLLTGTSKSVKLTFFKNSKKNGFEELQSQKMVAGQFAEYFQLDTEDPYATVPAELCFRPVDGQKIQMGGSYETINEAYFGVRLDPYCSGLPAQCAAIKNQTINNFLKLVNYNTYGLYMSENKYSPDQNRLISGIADNEVSESDYLLNASLMRTETLYVPSIELLDDTSKSFLRTPPKTIERTMAYSSFGDRNQQRKGNATADPAYILEIRPNGQLQQIILRSYKIDFLLGIIGGVFAFWYFFVHFFAKAYNAYKVRAKLAEVLHQEDGYDESMFVHFLHLIKVPSCMCCAGMRQDLDRVAAVDSKMQRDLDYLNLIKNVDNCYMLSSSLFDNIYEKDLSLIYFREKIDESEEVKPKRINELQVEEFEDDEFLEFDDEVPNRNLENSQLNATSTLLPEISQQNIDLEKLVNMGRSKEEASLYDINTPYRKQNFFSKVMKQVDLFKNPAELTLNGQRDVKSIFGGLIFFGLAACIIIVVYYFLKIYTSGSDYTVSHRKLVDGNLDVVDSSNTLGQLSQGINFISGQNFKFAVAFNKKDRYYPHNVTQYIFNESSPIGIRLLSYTVTKDKGEVNETYEATEFELCAQDSLKKFMSTYNDQQAFSNMSLAYCLPQGKTFTLKGIPQDTTRQYFKVNIYNKFGNATGKAYLNSFFKIYLVNYYMSVPRLDTFSKDFFYEMTKFNYLTDIYSIPIEQNLTFTKTVFTDKYYQRSKETYNDHSPKINERIDANYLSTENTRNLTFYYDGMIDHYLLDYPGGAELFGLVGGVIILFIFVAFSCVNSFNEYRMKYLIGQQLYTFDKKLSGLTKEKARKLNLKKIEEATKAINDFNEAQIFLGWILNPIGYMRDNYNFNKTLRRLTLLIDKVQSDINLYNVYKHLTMFKNVIDKNVKLVSAQEGQLSVKLSSVFIKHIYNPDTVKNDIHSIAKEAIKHRLSSFEQFKINKAIDAKVNPLKVLGGDKALNRAFGIDEGSLFRSRSDMREQREHVPIPPIIPIQEERFEEISQENEQSSNNQTRNVSSSHAKMMQEEESQQKEEAARHIMQNIKAFEIQEDLK